MKGTIIQSTGSWYLVYCEDGSKVESRIKGKFRLENSSFTNPVAVGDEVDIEIEDVGTGVIQEIFPRRNYLVRRSPKGKNMKHIVASNIDLAIIMASLKEPRTSPGFIDRCLLTSELYDIPAVLVFNKLDLYSQNELEQYRKLKDTYNDVGYEVYLISLKEGEQWKQLLPILKDKKSLLTGHSGVGKSTLINMLFPDLDLYTMEVSEQTGKGMHATTYATMYELETGGFIIDSPGLKEFGILDMEASQVGHGFKEMVGPIQKCRFHDCLHLNEPGCGVLKAVKDGAISESRYTSYVRIVEDIKENKEW